MQLIGIEFKKPTVVDRYIGLALIMFVAVSIHMGASPTIVGALSGGAVSAMFGVKSFRSIQDFLAAGCFGMVGAILCICIAPMFR